MNTFKQLLATRKARLTTAAIVAVISVVLVACTGNNQPAGDKQERDFTTKLQQNYNLVQPPHTYDYSQARENLIAAQDAMALGADSWTFQTVEGKGVSFACPSVGFPVPIGGQLTNPEKVVDLPDSAWLTTAQMEPYGYYPPADVRGTLGNCVLPSGEIGIFYSEPDLTTYMFDVTFDEERGIYVPSEDAVAAISVKNLTSEEVNIQEADITVDLTQEDEG